MPPFRKTVKQREAVKLHASSAMHIMLYGGSRSGKSFVNLRSIFIRACKCRSRHILFRKHFNGIKTSIWFETYPKLRKLCFPKLGIEENRTDWFLTFPNGSEVWIAGLDEGERTDKVLGKEYSTINFVEASEMSWDSVETAQSRLAENSGLELKAYYDMNPPNKRHWSYKLFVEGLHPETNVPLSDPQLYAALLMSPGDNKDNLPSAYINTILANMSERKRKRFLLGEFLDDTEGALWTADQISAYRCRPEEVPDLVRVVVGVDPAVTSKAQSDETGIVVAGVDERGHAYVLADRSLRDTPRKWAEATVGAYNDYDGDRVIGEVNNGGDLVEMNLRTVAESIPYKSVHASRGKLVRAEPIQSLYERGFVHHVGQFPDLEDEMCSWVPESSTWSPNRMDGLVWALMELGVADIVIHPSVYYEGQDRQKIADLDAQIEELINSAPPEERGRLRELVESQQ